MILLSRLLEQNLSAAGMHETTAGRGPSDRVPLFCELGLRIGEIAPELSKARMEHVFPGS